MATAATERVVLDAEGLKLEGRLTMPAAATAGAVICHPHPQYGGNMDNNVVMAVAEALALAGVATLRFNFRGVGSSQGRYDNGRGEATDARAAAALLRERVNSNAITLAGYSFGAMVALLAGQGGDINGIAAIAAPMPMFDSSFLDQCTKPKLFVLGDGDQYCPMRALETRMASLPEPKALVRIAGADHFFYGYEAQVAQAVVRFVTECG